MSKWTARILALICTVGTCLLLFQARFLTTAEGNKEFVFLVPGSVAVDEMAQQELVELMTRKFGEAGPTWGSKAVTYKGQAATMQEALSYEIEKLGQTFSNENYLQCVVKTTRTVTSPEGEQLAQASHDRSFLARDPAGEDRAYIFWDTLEESYHKNQHLYMQLGEEE